MNTALKTAEPTAGALIEQVVIGGDLARLTPEQRVKYYRDVCGSLGLNPLTRPFAYLTLNSKLVLYAQRDCTDQLRSLKGVSIKLVETKALEGVYLVRAQATDKGGRTDEATGAVSIATLKGEALCNAIMKAETKAKRRVTLSICGLGLMDETEVESVAGARPERIDPETGEVIHPPKRSDFKTPEAVMAGDAPKNGAKAPPDSTFGLPGVDADGVVQEQSEESAKAEVRANEIIAMIDKTTDAAKIDKWMASHKDELAAMRAVNEEAAMAVVSAADYRKRQLGAAA
jgi:hypothetical protein